MTAPDDRLTKNVPFDWTKEMADEACILAAEATDDKEKQVFIVGLLFRAWPRMLNAADGRWTR